MDPPPVPLHEESRHSATLRCSGTGTGSCSGQRGPAPAPGAPPPKPPAAERGLPSPLGPGYSRPQRSADNRERPCRGFWKSFLPVSASAGAADETDSLRGTRRSPGGWRRGSAASPGPSALASEPRHRATAAGTRSEASAAPSPSSRIRAESSRARSNRPGKSRKAVPGELPLRSRCVPEERQRWSRARCWPRPRSPGAGQQRLAGVLASGWPCRELCGARTPVRVPWDVCSRSVAVGSPPGWAHAAWRAVCGVREPPALGLRGQHGGATRPVPR